jgi:hypothetical protein
MTDDYMKYRGKCREFCDKLIKQDPSLILVRGFYHCPEWGKQQHWWCKKADGTIVDPTVRQFPTKGIGATYEEFDGWCECEVCGKRVLEADAIIDGRFALCSGKCHRELVGL